MKNILKIHFDEIEELHNKRNEALKTLNDLKSELEAAVNEVVSQFDDKHGKAVAELADSVEVWGVVIDTAIEAQIEKMTSYESGRSDSWHNSKASDQFEDWRESWKSYQSNAVESYQIIGCFEQIKFSDFTVDALPSGTRTRTRTSQSKGMLNNDN